MRRKSATANALLSGLTNRRGPAVATTDAGNPKERRIRAVAAGLACALLATILGAGAPAATAQDVAASLVGEALFAGPNSPLLQGEFTTTVNCNPSGSGAITYFADGVALGPYPGTFTESGTVVVSDELAPNGALALESFSASFTIVSGDTTITGTKELRQDVPIEEGISQGGCSDNGVFTGGAFVAYVSYSATINTPTGSFQDTGDAVVDAQELEGAGLPDGRISFFQESFTRSDGVVFVATEGSVTGGGWIGATNGESVSFGFEAKNQDRQGLRGHCTVIDHAADVRIRCLTVTKLVQGATHAYFEGLAEVNGVTETYRIDVDDIGEPPIADTFKIQTESYAAAGVVEGGNVQIHDEP